MDPMHSGSAGARDADARRRVLVVDDDDFVAGVEEFLTDHGYRVLVARTGEESGMREEAWQWQSANRSRSASWSRRA